MSRFALLVGAHRRSLLIGAITLLVALVAGLMVPGQASAICPINSDTCGVRDYPDPDLPPPTPALTGLTVVAATQTSTTISWNDSMTDETSYQVDWSEHSTYLPPGVHDATPVYTGPWTLPAQAGTGTYTWTHSNLNPNQTWTYTVWAVRNGARGASQTVTVSTVPNPPAAPSLNVCDSNQPGVDLCWSSGTIPPGGVPNTSYEIQRQAPGGSTWSVDGTTGSTATTWTDGLPLYGATWCWRVVAISPGGRTPSNTACYAVPNQPPNTPTSFSLSGSNGVLTARWNGDSTATSYQLNVTVGSTTYPRTVTGGWTGAFSAQIPGIACGAKASATVQAQAPGAYAGSVVGTSTTVGCATAPEVTNLAGAGSGNSITWTWDGSALDSGYTVTLSDTTSWLIYSPQNVGGGHNGAVTFTSPNLVAGDTYHLLVVTHRAGNWDSSGAGAYAQLGTASTGVREVDVYNCSGAGARTLWMSTGGSYTNAGVASDGGGAGLCGPGASTPLKISLPTALVTLVATDDGQPPNGTDNVKYTQMFVGSDTGGVVPAILTTS